MSQIEDMKEMIHREIQRIPNLTERVTFKTLMEEVFLSLYETNEKMYADLEKRVQDELAYDVNRYGIKTGIIEQEYYDESHHLMSPMDEDDLKVKQYTMADIITALEEKGEFSIMKVMIHCDYMQLLDIWNGGIEFQGTMETSNPEKTWEITVTLRQNIEYLRKIGQLYQLFIKNGIPWQTINAPYLYKMADVILTKLPEGIQREEQIQKVQINFGVYHPFICYGLIPIWNIKKLVLDSIGFPIPCGDHKNFEHSVSIRDYGIQHAYLVEDDSEIQSISQREERLLITSEASETKTWNIYIIRNSEESKIDRYTYPIMQNERMENFAEKFQRKWGQSIKTKAELARFIKGFQLEEYVIYEDCNIMQEFEKIRETYGMNPFVEDELRDVRMQKKLILYFKSGKKEAWLQRDIASFIVSEVQRFYPEYECGGILL